MDINNSKSATTEAKTRMAATIEHLRHELAGVRTGRASITMLDSVKVDAYGTSMPLNQVAGLSIPEPTLIAVQPFDLSLLEEVEKGINRSNLGLNPNNDGKIIRIPIPALTEDRRQELSRVVHSLVENSRTSVRQIRRNINDQLKKLLKDRKLSEDDQKNGLDEVQKVTDQFINEIDELQKTKDFQLLNQ